MALSQKISQKEVNGMGVITMNYYTKRYFYKYGQHSKELFNFSWDQDVGQEKTLTFEVDHKRVAFHAE